MNTISTFVRSAATPAWVAQTRINTPLGELLLAATARGLAGAWFDAQQHHPGAVSVVDDARHPVLRAAARAFACYWAEGATSVTPQQLDGALAFDPAGTPFQHAVWRALLAIAPGRTDSYGAIARRLGRADAARAVGAAVGRNPIAILVPCHRVVGSGGALTGYAAGLPRKHALLQHEGVLAAVSSDLFTGEAA